MIEIAGILKKTYKIITDVMAVIAGLLLIGIMLAITYSVIMRAFFDKPVPWVMEITTYGLLYITFLGAPWLLRHDGHVKVDLLINRVSQYSQTFFEIITSTIGLVVSGAVFWFGLQVTLDNFSRNIVVINMLATPKYILLAVIPLGGFFLLVEFTQRIIGRIRSLDNKAGG